MTRAGLREGPATARPTSHCWRHSHGCLSLHTQSPSSRPWGQKQPNNQERTYQQGGPNPGANIPNPNAGMSHDNVRAPHPQSHAWRPLLTDLSDTCPHHQALHAHPTDELLSHSLSDLHLHPSKENLEVRWGEVELPCMPKDALLLCTHQWQSVHP